MNSLASVSKPCIGVFAVLRYSSIRIAMVFPCALTRLHRSTDVSFAGAITKMGKMNESRGKTREDERAGREASLLCNQALTRDYFWSVTYTTVARPSATL
jgi:hypothetical protein